MARRATGDHTITRTYNNLKGFSTDNIYARPVNIATTALNMMLQPDNSFGSRRGFQAQTADIGGLGSGTFEPNNAARQNICVDPDGCLYREIPYHLYMSYSGNGYIQFNVFTDQSTGFDISFKFFVRQAAQVTTNQTNVNVVNTNAQLVATGNVISFININTQKTETRNVTGTTGTSITFSGAPASFLAGQYIDLEGMVQFGNGYDVLTPFTIADFIAALASLNISGLTLVSAGPDNVPAAFIPCVEDSLLLSGKIYTFTYYSWEKIPSSLSKLFPLFTTLQVLNSEDFENSSFASFDQILYVATGYDPLVKYDGQNAYYAGMPDGQEPSLMGGAFGANYLDPGIYQYAISYEQIDNAGHIVEGNISFPKSITLSAAQQVIVSVPNVEGNSGFNTSLNIATAGTADVYGPDIDGFYYDHLGAASVSLVDGDNGYYYDYSLATCNLTALNTNTFQVAANHDIEVGDTIVFTDSVNNQEVKRVVLQSTPANTITLDDPAFNISSGTVIKGWKTHKIYTKIGIVNGVVSNSNIITIKAAPFANIGSLGIQVGDQVTFIDSNGNTQIRGVSAVNTGANTITITQLPVSIPSLTLLTFSPGLTNAFWIQKEVNRATVISLPELFVSNNLRVNIYRTKANGTEFFLVASIPATPGGNYVFTDVYKDSELGIQYRFLDRPPALPPIGRYVIAYQNQLIIGGTADGSPENDDAVYFSEGNQPENFPAATNFFLVPSNDDQVSGIGVAGSTLIIGKDSSIHAISGSLITSQYEVLSVQPGSNIGIAAHATITSIGGLMYFMSQSGVYTIAESQMFPVDELGVPIPISRPISGIFRSEKFLPEYKFVFKRATAVHYKQDNQYLLFIPCEDANTPIRTANQNSRIFCWDYEGKNWFEWSQINAAGGFMLDGRSNKDLLWQERRNSGFIGPTANTYQQRRNYRLTDYADHTHNIPVEWKSSWEDLGEPEVRKKFIRARLLFDRIESLFQHNFPELEFTSYSDRIGSKVVTKTDITTVFNFKVNSSYSLVPWSWGVWSGYEDSFAAVNLKNSQSAKSCQIGFKLNQLNTNFSFSGFQLEISPAFRRTIVR